MTAPIPTCTRALRTIVDENLTVASKCDHREIYQEVIARERRGDYLGATVAGDPARHERHQGEDLRASRDPRPMLSSSKSADVGDYRKPSIPRGDPPAQERPRPPERLLRSLLCWCRWSWPGDEDQAHSALGAGSAAIGIQPDAIICRRRFQSMRTSRRRLPSSRTCRARRSCRCPTSTRSTKYR